MSSSVQCVKQSLSQTMLATGDTCLYDEARHDMSFYSWVKDMLVMLTGHNVLHQPLQLRLKELLTAQVAKPPSVLTIYCCSYRS